MAVHDEVGTSVTRCDIVVHSELSDCFALQ
jgi:hypothetical protein